MFTYFTFTTFTKHLQQFGRPFSSQNSSLSVEKIGINVSVLGPHIQNQGTTSDPWTALRKPHFSSKETQKYYVIG
jgi:hypothetical protein